MIKVKVGDRAPDFTLLSQTGEEVTLSKFFGNKSIVLYFYPTDKGWTCKREACGFRDNYETFKELGAEVIGISSDGVESHKSFAARYNLPFILLSDMDNKVRRLYGVPSTLGLIPGRVTYVIDKAGIIRLMFLRLLQPKKHIDQTLGTLRKLQN